MLTERKTLLILMPGFPKDEQDSTCLPAQQQFVRCFNQKYPDISLVILSFQYPYEASEYFWFGNRVIAFGGRNKGGLSRFLLREKIKIVLSNLKDQNNLTGVLSFWAGETALLGNHFSRKHSIPHFIWLMGQDAKSSNSYIKKIKPSPTEIVAISESIQTGFTSAFNILPAHVIPLGICTEDHPSKKTNRDIDILCAGSLIPLKQFDVGIDIIQTLQKKYPQLKALICGAGPEQRKLKEKIVQKGLSNIIELTGELPHKQLMQTMARSRILLHPSIYEGFSGVCLEALSLGMDVVSFCKPMNAAITGWHIAQSVEEGGQIINKLLLSKTSYESNIPFKMADTVRSIGGLFNLEKQRNSFIPGI